MKGEEDGEENLARQEGSVMRQQVGLVARLLLLVLRLRRRTSV